MMDEKLFAILMKLLQENEIYQWDIITIFKGISISNEVYIK